jgi:NPCBM/NEW2 domain
MSNGALAAGDGGPITLNGVSYPKGLGVHSTSHVVYALGGQYQAFAAAVGVDDECGSMGSVVFQVFVNGAKRFDSAKMTATSPTKPVLVDTTGANQLKLTVTAAGDGGACDHADWADARLTTAG